MTLQHPYLSASSMNLRTLCNELGNVQHKAYEIGVQLGISLGKLKELKKNGNLLLESLDFWLNGNTDVPVTWESVVNALESDFVKETGCAERIRKKHLTSEG